MSTQTVEFSIQQPLLESPECEYFSVQYQKLSPVLGVIQTIPDFSIDTFLLTLGSNSVYEIKVKHHCCNGSDSDWVTTTYNTNTNAPYIYSCFVENPVSDDCATTSGGCRNCSILKSYTVKFFSDSQGINPYNTQSNVVLRIQESLNSILQLPYNLTLLAGQSEYVLFTKTTYQEECIDGNSSVNTLSVNLLAGESQTTPYTVISCVSNNPTLLNTSNASTGVGGIRTQVFTVGADILPGNKFQITIYNVVKTTTAVVGDTPTSIATKLRSAINAATESQWNAFGFAAIGQVGFKPVSDSTGSTLTIYLNNSDVAYASALTN